VSGIDARDTTWGRRWEELLGGSDGDPRRFNQGRAFQRSGRVSGVRVDAGRLVGQVQGSRATPYLVEVMLPVLDDASWRTVVEVIAGQVRHAARLLAGQQPEGLEDDLEARGIALFGEREALDARCACGEADRPCAHVIALWEDVAERLAGDPFALLRLRGRGRERLLAELGTARRREGAAEVGLDPATLSASGWTRAPRDAADLEIGAPGRPETPAGPLRLLGDPPGWAGNVSAWDLFRPAIVRAAGRARRLLD
jgi:uncharacterized Zn finger protein